MSKLNESFSRENRSTNPTAFEDLTQQHSQLNRIGEAAGFAREQMEGLHQKSLQVAQNWEINVDSSELINGFGMILEQTKDLDYVIENAENFATAMQGLGASTKDVAEAFVHFQKQGISGAQTVEALGKTIQAVKATGSDMDPLEFINNTMTTLEDPGKEKDLEQLGIRIFDQEKLKKGERVRNPLSQILAEMQLSMSADKHAEYADIFGSDTASVIGRLSQKDLRKPSSLKLDALDAANSAQGYLNNTRASNIQLAEDASSTGDPQKYTLLEKQHQKLLYALEKTQGERLHGRPEPSELSPDDNGHYKHSQVPIGPWLNNPVQDYFIPEHLSNIVTELFPTINVPLTVGLGAVDTVKAATDDGLNARQKVEKIYEVSGKTLGALGGGFLAGFLGAVGGQEIMGRAFKFVGGQAYDFDQELQRNMAAPARRLRMLAPVMGGILDLKSPGWDTGKPSGGAAGSMLNGASSWLNQSTQNSPNGFANLFNGGQLAQSGPVQHVTKEVFIHLGDQSPVPGTATSGGIVQDFSDGRIPTPA